LVSYLWISKKFNSNFIYMGKHLRTIEWSLNIFDLCMLHISFIKRVVLILKSSDCLKLIIFPLTLRSAIIIKAVDNSICFFCFGVILAHSRSVKVYWDHLFNWILLKFILDLLWCILLLDPLYNSWFPLNLLWTWILP
jgi:hypothetical protein